MSRAQSAFAVIVVTVLFLLGCSGSSNPVTNNPLQTPERPGQAIGTSHVLWGLWSVVAGLIGYVLYGIGAPGADLARTLFGGWAALLVALICGAIPVLARFRTADL